MHDPICQFDAGEVAELPTAGPVRVALTPRAAELLQVVVAKHGPVMFHQRGGCCDGSAPMCYALGTFLTGAADVHLGDLEVPGMEPVPVWMGRAQYQAWRHTRLTIDAVPGKGAGLSLEGPEGMRFLTRSRLFTDEEAAALPPL
ncbi:DUF779 domain-containing protein [Gephyromycinifex aptenodytis]|uniref:DUF779 domain-containing protein n=1 Tax=Gephyromycinifex aptenodytis TaxID=2716227 RepID=UPI001446A1D8|nr:DUF779 domain-containing protein [Gephyromycinifex aptenodytis]